MISSYYLSFFKTPTVCAKPLRKFRLNFYRLGDMGVVKLHGWTRTKLAT